MKFLDKIEKNLDKQKKAIENFHKAVVYAWDRAYKKGAVSGDLLDALVAHATYIAALNIRNEGQVPEEDMLDSLKTPIRDQAIDLIEVGFFN